MKKYLLKTLTILLLLLTGARSVHAQFERGNLTIGAEHDLGYSKYGINDPTHNFTLGGSLGVFLSPTVLTGISLAESSNNSIVARTLPNQLYRLGIFTRKFFNPGKHGLWLEGNVSYSYGENERPILYAVPQYTQLVALGGRIGGYLFVTRTIALQASFEMFTMTSLTQWHERRLNPTEHETDRSEFTFRLHVPGYTALGNFSLGAFMLLNQKKS